MSHVVTAKSPVPDAVNRAARTLWQGLIVDALVLIGVGLASMMDSGIDPTQPLFWAAAGGLVIKSALTATASFLVRLKVAPPA